MAITEDFQTRICTDEHQRVVFVDKYDDNEVWLSIQVSGGGANCVLHREQAIEMIAAIQRVLDNVPNPPEVPELEEVEE
jgi:hypothetical protein